jgi:hypothetical protein
MRARSDAQRRYLKRTMAFAILYMGSIALLSALGVRQMGGLAVYPLATLPGFAIAGVFWAIGRLIVEEKDEFMRMLIVRQTLIATGFALGLATIYGFLTAFAQAPHLELYWVSVAWFAGLGVGAAANKIRYGTSGECA